MVVGGVLVGCGFFVMVAVGFFGFCFGFFIWFWVFFCNGKFSRGKNLFW